MIRFFRRFLKNLAAEIVVYEQAYRSFNEFQAIAERIEQTNPTPTTENREILYDAYRRVWSEYKH